MQEIRISTGIRSDQAEPIFEIKFSLFKNLCFKLQL